MVIWFTGMSGAGKSTLAENLGSVLEQKGLSIYNLDGDAVRKSNKTVNKFHRKAIIQNNHLIIDECIRTVEKHDFIIVSVVSPFEETRRYARQSLLKSYFEVYVKCPIAELIRRDTKGLYQKAQLGEINNLIGFSAKLPYEEPECPDLEIRTDQYNNEESIAMIMSNLSI
jgi:adenylylsulfate kinase